MSAAFQTCVADTRAVIGRRCAKSIEQVLTLDHPDTAGDVFKTLRAAGLEDPFCLYESTEASSRVRRGSPSMPSDAVWTGVVPRRQATGIGECRAPRGCGGASERSGCAWILAKSTGLTRT